MKINSQNAKRFVNHIDTISKLSGKEYYEASKIYLQLRRLELKANRLTNLGCERELTESEEKILDSIFSKVKKLLPNAKTFFINYDPRGYALKLKESEAKELNIYQDWGGYGILAPEF